MVGHAGTGSAPLAQSRKLFGRPGRGDAAGPDARTARSRARSSAGSGSRFGFPRAFAQAAARAGPGRAGSNKRVLQVAARLVGAAASGSTMDARLRPPPQPAPATLPAAIERPGAASAWLVGAVRSDAAAGSLRSQHGRHAGWAACQARRSDGPESAKSAPNGAAIGSGGSRRRLRTHVSKGQQHGVRPAAVTKRPPLQRTVAITVPGGKMFPARGPRVQATAAVAQPSSASVAPADSAADSELTNYARRAAIAPAAITVRPGGARCT